MRSVYFYLIQSLCLIICEVNARALENEQVLIVVSYDGFRNEYMRRNVTPNILELRRQGTYADYINNVFPTKTFTNHHSIATGLYPGAHGVTANEVYDTKSGLLGYGYELFHYNPDILPIWTLNEKNGGTSGCMMWPGSNFEYSNTNCTYVEAYKSAVPLKERVDTVITWLKNTRKPPNLVMIYFEVPDKLAHAVGPESPRITEIIAQLDTATKYLHDEIARNNFANRVNIIHLSDHGMQGVNSHNFINLTNFIEPSAAKMYGTSPVIQIVPTEGKEDDVYNKLKNAAVDNGNFHVYNHNSLQKRWRCQNKRRLGPIIAVANLGYAFQDMWGAAEYYEKHYNVTFTPDTFYGVHGYDNELSVMQPFFVANGPLFKEHYKIQPFNTVDLYSLFSYILKIDNVPQTDGDISNVASLLREYNTPGKLGTGGIFAIVFVLAGLVVIIFGIYSTAGKDRLSRMCGIINYRLYR